IERQVQNRGQVDIEAKRPQAFGGDLTQSRRDRGVLCSAQKVSRWSRPEYPLQPVNRPPFLVDSYQGRDRDRRTNRRCKLDNLMACFGVARDQDDSGRLNPLNQFASRLIELSTRQADE